MFHSMSTEHFSHVLGSSVNLTHKTVVEEYATSPLPRLGLLIYLLKTCLILRNIKLRSNLMVAGNLAKSLRTKRGRMLRAFVFAETTESRDLCQTPQAPQGPA